ncbi:MAG: GNAT family N-acetyltransferase [Pseudomonadota bacterium]
MSFLIRPCGRGDALALSTVASATFVETYAGIVDGRDILAHCQTQHGAGAYEAWLGNPATPLLMATIDPGACPIGYAMLSPPDLPVPGAEGDLELKRIYVLHRFHGDGVGLALLEAAVEAARAVGARRMLLGAYAENHRAIAFYKRNGFVQVGTRVFHVGDNDYDDVVLARDLTA